MKKLASIAASASLLLFASWAQANKEEEAAKYTNDLKTSQITKVKIEAATKIGELGQIKKSWAKDAIPYLIQACKHSDVKLRIAAAEALGKIDPPADSKALDTLVEMVKKDKELRARHAAARGLGHMGPSAKSAIPALREAASKTKDRRESRPFTDAVRTINARR